MAYIYQKSSADLYDALQKRFSDIGISSKTPDSFINILNEFITDELYTLSGEFNAKLGEYSLYTAEGEALDRLADETYGVQRFGQAKASVSDGILFTNNSTSEIEVREGTLLSSGNSFNESGTVYRVTSDVTVPENGTAFASAIAVQSGFEHNVEENFFTSHDTGIAGLSVRNIYPIVNGRDIESDSNFRARLLSYLPSVASSNLEWLRLNLLDVPGVLNIKFIQGYNGLGTMGVFASTAGNKTNSEIKTLIESRIQEIKTPGDKLVYNEAYRKIFDITVELIDSRNYSTSEIDQLKYSIRSLIGEEFVRAKSRNRIDFRTIESRITSNLRSRFSFSHGGNDSIFSNITCRTEVGTGAATLPRPITSLAINDGSFIVDIKADEIPELGDITINVSLTL